MRILVTDGENRAALAIVRALGRAGHTVVVGGRRAPCLAQTSRYCQERVVYPDPAREEEAFVRRLAELVETQRIGLLLPVTDITTLLVTTNRARFEPACLVPFADAAVIARAADKVDVLKTAMRLGIPVPRSVFVESREQCLEHLDLPFPVVVKPHRSRTRTAHGWISSSVSFAQTPKDLTADIARRPDAEFPLVVQETIQGPGMGVFVCYRAGALVGLFCHRRIREKPPAGGVSVLSESVEVSPEARDYAERLMREIGWEGVSMVEFKWDERDNGPKLMEINGRFWGSLQLAIDAGVDFPNLLASAAAGVGAAAPPPFRTGVRNRWFWGDVDALLIQLFGRGEGRGRVAKLGRMRALADFLPLWGRDLYYENPQFGDLRPFFHETASWLRGAQ
jgi:predicted ATP-grasp superfamily ATP-dependent carboligase